MRVTQSMVMNSYSSRLGKIFADMDKTNQRLISQRKFLTAAEDPASAARAYQLRRSMQQNDDYLNNVKNIRDTLGSVESNMMMLNEMAKTAYADIIAAKNGTIDADTRAIYAEQIRSMQKTAIDALNSKFDDKYMFGGSSTKELPFSLSADGQTLLYRGLDVTDPANQSALAELADEKLYIDVGFGLTVDMIAGKPVVNSSSAFNTATPGIKFLGFGTNASDNFILNLGLIAEELEKPTLDYNALNVLAEKLDTQRKDIMIAVTQIGTDSNFLEYRQGVLETNNDNLNNKILSVEYVDLEQAITDYKMADYVYRAALQVGTNILTPSFIDFMN